MRRTLPPPSPLATSVGDAVRPDLLSLVGAGPDETVAHRPSSVDITCRTPTACRPATSDPAPSDVLPGASAPITVTGPASNTFGISFGALLDGTLAPRKGTGLAAITATVGCSRKISTSS